MIAKARPPRALQGAQQSIELSSLTQDPKLVESRDCEKSGLERGLMCCPDNCTRIEPVPVLIQRQMSDSVCADQPE